METEEKLHTPLSVRVDVHMVQSDRESGETDEHTYVSFGTMQVIDGELTLRYGEPETVTGGAAIETEVIFADGITVLAHTGGVECRWHLVLGKTVREPYHVGPFSVEMELAATRVENRLSLSGGKVLLEYLLRPEGELKYILNRLELDVSVMKTVRVPMRESGKNE